LSTFEIGTVLGDYEIVGLIGSGGMGTVYRVRHGISDRAEAMKVLLANLRTSPELGERFLREIKIQASLSHPNIASLYTVQRYGDQLLMFMELVEGESLHDRMQRGGIELPEALSYARQILSALGYAHQRGVIHRDVKPRNILLTRNGVVKLTDFGIATSREEKQITRPGVAVGSLLYMSPEQVKGQRGDARSDLYSTGLLLYEITTGQHPVHADSDYAIMAAQLLEVPRPPIELRPTLPPSLSQAIMKALEKDPDKRFQNADDFRAALECRPTQDDVPTQVRPVSDAPSAAVLNSPQWDAAQLESIRKEFAVYIGPMARILVERSSKRARSLDELYELLASEIPSTADRAKFLRSRPKT
jgi:serine/threonine-protein kinase